MHRTSYMPRLPLGKVLLASLFFLIAAAGAARAQLPDGPSVLVVPVGQTRTVEMSTQKPIKEVRADNPKVASVKPIIGDPTRVLVTALSTGNSMVSLTDADKKTETFEVRVPADDEVIRQENRRKLLELIRQAAPTAIVDVVATPNNTVILTGTVDNIEYIHTLTELARSFFGINANVVNNMRVGGVHQVQIEVTVARVNRSEFRSFGFSFLETGQHHFLASTVGGAGTFAGSIIGSVMSPAAALSSTPNAVFGVVSDKQGFVGFLSALRTEGLAKLNADAYATTLSGRPGNVLSGGETPILTTSGTGAPNVTYKQFGTLVNFLPIVKGNGKIHLEVRATVSSLNAAAGINIPSAVGVTSVPGFDTRFAEAAVLLEDGQTLAIGGLIQNAINGTTNKVPVLGDLPFVGVAFSTKSYTESEEELLILVTPRVVDGMACTQLPHHMPGRETRSPDDFELFLEGILEAPRGQRTPCPDGSCSSYTAAHRTGPTAGIYPCGDATQPGNCRGRFGSTGCANGTCGPQGCSPSTSPWSRNGGSGLLNGDTSTTPAPMPPPADTVFKTSPSPAPSATETVPMPATPRVNTTSGELPAPVVPVVPALPPASTPAQPASTPAQPARTPAQP
jgi:pilus assembly protein CpaC